MQSELRMTVATLKLRKDIDDKSKEARDREFELYDFIKKMRMSIKDIRDF